MNRYEILIRNGSIADGTGGSLFKGDIGLNGEIIEYVGSDNGVRGETEIDASGLIVSPGFIDMHSHSDVTALIYPESESKIRQGVTTEVVGNCGISMAPVVSDTLEQLKELVDGDSPGLSSLLDWNWKSLTDYFERVNSMGNTVNFAPLVGHNSLRIAVMGFENREPSDDELRKMKSLVEEEMKNGFFGLSTGLVYPPGFFARTREVIEVAKVASRHNGIYASHIRNEGRRVLESASEAIEVGKAARIPVEISHVKVMGRNNWDLDTSYAALIQDARREGLEVSADLYPYTAGQTFLWSALPPWAQDGGIEKALLRLKNPADKEKIRNDILTPGKMERQNWVEDSGWEGIVLPEKDGNSIQQISERLQKDPFEVLCDVLLEKKGQASMIVHSMREESILRFLSLPSTAIGSDHNGITPGRGPLGGLQHPRAYGAFPRFLGKYVRERGVMSLEEGIKRMTGLASAKLRLDRRGLIKQGYFADIVIFDQETIDDTATFESPLSFPIGISYVIVNGVITAKNGSLTGNHNGKILRRKMA